MQIKLGEHLRDLRRRDGRTQEELAQALGVTPQAVSRWENSSCYPDMELLPVIANYFGVSIDDLFGYDNDRDRRIDAILQEIDAFHIKSRGDDEWVDACLEILRTGLAEFPQNERLRITLADTLSEAGWRRHHEWLYYDEEGYIQHNYDQHKKNPYWAESVEICENLVSTASDHAIVTRSISILVLLYRNLGETEKAVAYANRMPELKNCREVLLAAAVDGKEEAKYIGELLLELAGKFAEQLVYGLITDLNHYQSDMPAEKIKGAIAVFYLICDDGNFGKYHDKLIRLYLYLSRLQWERGYHDDAFVSLDESLKHARALE
ncbi:MAG: helix-turn-helix domain-containing protein, partial [Oscillospiraceae bacterium]|nr:helix-turn-helix domain-containing protein [Oscillospiraceae bacterium]